MQERDGQKFYQCKLSFSEVKDRRVKLVDTFFTSDVAAPSTMVECFRVDGVGPVCAEYCSRAYGIPPGAWNKLVAAARSGRLAAGLEWDMDGPMSWSETTIGSLGRQRLWNGGRCGFG